MRDLNLSAGFLICMAFGASSFAAPRDEDLAYSFVICAETIAMFLDEMPGIAAARGGVDELRRSYDLFYQAAEIKSDKKYADEMSDLAAVIIDRELDEEPNREAELLSRTDGCTRWFERAAVPVLEQDRSR